jgi:signal transduction histidine kinase
MSFRHHPRRSIRLRLAALLTTLFVLLGLMLLGVSYVIVRSNLTENPHELAETAAERLGLEPRQGSGSGELGPLGQALPRNANGDDPRHGRVERIDHERFVAQIQEVQDDLTDDSLRSLTVQYLAILAVMVPLSGGLGWFMSGRILRPVSEITETARRVSNESLHERIDLEGPDDELKQLADTFDSMLARLEAGFERQAAFVSNASHELRTPLSVIRAEVDVTLADEADDPEALRRSLEVVREAGERSERLIDALLVLARVDRDDQPRIELDLSELVSRVADETDLEGLRLELALDPAPVLGDRELLRAMTANLIDNAVRHNAPGGWIAIRTGSAGQEARLEIANSGRAITPEEAASLAEPFRRLGAARTGSGLGLGLSIAASVARAHGGELAIDPLERGGLRVAVALPAAMVELRQMG